MVATRHILFPPQKLTHYNITIGYGRILFENYFIYIYYSMKQMPKLISQIFNRSYKTIVLQI